MSKPKRTPFYAHWATYFIGVLIVMLGLFMTLEYSAEVRMPSDDWSLGVAIDHDITDDGRLIDHAPLREGDLFAYIKAGKLHLTVINHEGQKLKQATFDQVGQVNVVKVIVKGQGINIYTTDRKNLMVHQFDANLKWVASDALSDQAFYLEASDNYLLIGDETQVSLLKDHKLVYSFEDYEDLKSLDLLVDGDRVYMAVNAFDGMTLIKYGEGDPLVVSGMTASETLEYGYVEDMMVSGDQLTYMTSGYDRFDGKGATKYQVSHLNKDSLEEKEVYYYLHATSMLSPQLLQVEGNRITYVLGTQQIRSLYSDGTHRLEHLNQGKFTNVSRFTRQGNDFIENTRLTNTRKYPIAYFYTKKDGQPFFYWFDRYAKSSSLHVASTGPDYQAFSKDAYTIDWGFITVGTVMSYANSLFTGLFNFVMTMMVYWKWLVGFPVLVTLFYRFASFDKEKKAKLLFYLSVVFTAGIKWYALGYNQTNFSDYSLVYPAIFNSALAMHGLPLFGSAFSYFLLSLWKKQHPYYDKRSMHYWLYFAFEMIILQMTLYAFITSAIWKMNYML